MIQRCEQELTSADVQPRRAARLHYEIARHCEGALRSREHAVYHFLAAYKLAPDDANVVRGARRSLLAADRHLEALRLIDAELRLTPNPHDKANLHHLAGRVHLDELGSRSAARTAFDRAAQLDRANPAHWLALERADNLPQTAIEVRAKLADLGADDPHFRAAQIAAQAHLLELHDATAQRAPSELYDAALRLHPDAPEVLAALRRLAHTEGRWQDLVTWLQRDVELTTDDALKSMTLYRIARVHADRLDSTPEAVEALDRAAELSPSDVLVAEEQARLFEAEERWEALVAALARRVELTTNPSEQLAIIERIGHLTEHRLGRPDEAARWHAKALDLDPLHVPSLHARGTYLRVTERWQELVLMLSAEAREADTTERRTAAHMRIADVFGKELGDRERAASHFANVLTQDPGHTVALEQLLRLYRSSGRWREMAEVLKRAIATPALNVDVADRVYYLYELGSLYEDRLDEPNQAVEAYRAILDLDGTDLRAVRALGRAARRGGRDEVTLEAIDREIGLTTDRARQVRLDTAAATLLAGPLSMTDQAIRRFGSALERDPSHSPALSGLGRLYYNLGRWDDLLDVYRREQALQPMGPKAVKRLHKMGEIALERLGDAQRAAQFFDQAARLDPTHAASTLARAHILKGHRRWTELAAQLDTELKHATHSHDRARIAYKLGVIAEERLANAQRAGAAYEVALKERPGFTPAADALQRLRTRAGDWPRLVTDLMGRAERIQDRRLKVASWMLAGQLWRDRLHNAAKATECFEAVLQTQADYLPALRALAPLHRQQAQAEAVARTCTAIARSVSAPSTRAAYLAEAARVAEDSAVRRVTLEQQLSDSPGDALALNGLEDLALAELDVPTLIEIDRARLADEDPRTPLGDSRTRLAESLEMSLRPEALEAYKEALNVDPESLSAAEGYARMAKDAGSPEACVDALERLAKVQTDGAAACDDLVRAVDILRDTGGQGDRAVDLLIQGLEVSPEHVEAAVKLSERLLSDRQVGRLVDLLSHAASRSADPDRACQLWVEIARLQSAELPTPDAGAAIASLEKVVQVRPEHLEARSFMARIYERNNQWPEAATQLAYVAARTPDLATRQDARLKLADICRERLNDHLRALSALKEFVAEEPERLDGLERMFALSVARGLDQQTVTWGARLLTMLEEPVARAQVHRQLGRLHARRGHWELAGQALLQAIPVEGPGGEAATAYRAFIDAHGDYERYAEALGHYISEDAHRRPEAAAFQALATVQRDNLREPSGAIETLRAGVRAWPRDVPLLGTLASLLKSEGRTEPALAAQISLVGADVSRAESWRELAATFFSMRRRDEARVALGPLALLGEATAEELDELSKYPPKPGHARRGSFDTDSLRRMGELSAAPNSLESLVQLLSHAVYRLDRFRPALEEYGLSGRDRLTSRSSAPERAMADEIAAIFGVDEFELFLHSQAGPLSTVEPGDKPMVLLARWAVEAGPAWATYGLAHAFACIALELHPVLKIRGRDLPILLAAAGRTAIGGFGEGLTTSHFLDSLGRSLVKAMPRKHRKQFETAAYDYASETTPVDLAAWTDSVERTCRRAAALLCDDVRVVVAATAGVRTLSPPDALALTREHAAVASVLGFWVSEQANVIRKRAGLSSRAL